MHLRQRHDAVIVDIILFEQRAHGCGKLVKVHTAVMVPIDDRNCDRLIDLDAALIDGEHFIGIKAAIVICIRLAEVLTQTRFQFGPGDLAVVV